MGWYTDVPGDDNLYKTAYDAMNAIDEQLGGIEKLGYAKRRERGIQIVGKKNKIGWSVRGPVIVIEKNRRGAR